MSQHGPKSQFAENTSLGNRSRQSAAAPSWMDLHAQTASRPLVDAVDALDVEALKKAYRHLQQQHAQTLERLKKAEARSQSLFRLSPDAIVIVQYSDGRIVEVNPSFEQLSGYTGEEVVGKTTMELGLWERATDRRQLRQLLVTGGSVKNFETRFILNNGYRMHALVSATNLPFDSTDRLMVVIRDINHIRATETILRGHREALQLQNDWLHRVQNDLSASRQQYQDLFESAPVGYCTLNRQGLILSVNHTGAQMLAQTTEALCGTPIGFLVAEEYKQVVTDHLRRVFQSKKKATCEVKLNGAAGPPRFFRLISSAIPDDSGAFKHCRTAFLDDTERRRAQSSLGVANRFLSIANRLRNVDDTLKEFLSEMKRSTNCEALGIRMLTDANELPLVLSEGFPERFIKTEKRVCGRTKACLCDKVIAQATDQTQPFFTGNGTFFSPRLVQSIPLIMQMENFESNGTCPEMGFQTLAIIPIRSGETVLGLVMVADMRPDALDRLQVNMLENAALQLGNSIRRARVEKALRRSHEELEERVAARTAEVVETNTRLKEQVTRRERAERRLKHSQQMLQKVFDGISDPLVLTDAQMQVQMINRAAQDYYGLTSTAELAGLPCYRLLPAKAEACITCPIPEAVAAGRPADFERQGFQDAERTEKVVIYPLDDTRDNRGGAVIRIQDITDEKAMERQLIQSEKLASLGTLVSSVAHEINNPNSFISFNMPILREYLEAILPITDAHAATRDDLELFNMPYGEFRSDLLHMIDNIEHGSQRINAVLSNLREFSAARPSIAFKPVALSPLIDKALALVGPKLRNTVKKLDIDLPPDLPEVYTDESALEQILVNLLVNAAQAADKSDAWIRLKARSGNDSDTHTILTVSDNGCGMTEAVQANIFAPFFSTKLTEGGTGLGLYVCRKLIRQLGGRIDVMSTPGEGSRFSVTLPDKQTLVENR
jgi:PAS domain S-box-containing protein